jgi:hypothetical protein
MGTGSGLVGSTKGADVAPHSQPASLIEAPGAIQTDSLCQFFGSTELTRTYRTRIRSLTYRAKQSGTMLLHLWQMGTSATIWRQHVAHDGPFVMRKEARDCRRAPRPATGRARFSVKPDSRQLAEDTDRPESLNEWLVLKATVENRVVWGFTGSKRQ